MKPLPSIGSVVGLDMGIQSFAVTDHGVEYPNHKYLAKFEKKLARLQRKLSRKTKGSNRREKARLKVARLYEHIANQRSDMLHKLSTHLLRENDVKLRPQLEYKGVWYGKTVFKVNRFYPSSQLCSSCGAQWPGTKELSVREWICPVCGVNHKRDVNAAKNILEEGLGLLL